MKKAWNSTLRASNPLKAKKGFAKKIGSSIKRRTPKKRAGHNKTYLDACRGEPCYLRMPGICIGGIDTVVPCHSNEHVHGKGMGLKARDEFTVPGCYVCHTELDQGMRFNKEQKFGFWRVAYARWEPVRRQKLKAKENPSTVCAVMG